MQSYQAGQRKNEIWEPCSDDFFLQDSRGVVKSKRSDAGTRAKKGERMGWSYFLWLNHLLI